MIRTQSFPNRRKAGRLLAEGLQPLLKGIRHGDLVILGIPRGGVPVAREVAAMYGAPLDVVIVRKLGVPSQPELAMGAVGEGGVRVLNRDVIDSMSIRSEEIERVARDEVAEIGRRVDRYREGRSSLHLTGKTVVIVDDGLATGSTAIAACQVVRACGADRVILAVPVAPFGWTSVVGNAADDLFTLSEPRDFMSVGQFYDEFEQVDDAEVRAIIADSATTSRSVDARDITVDAGRGVHLSASLMVPDNASSVVFFAHGSGSGRLSPRNLEVSRRLNDVGIATVLVDLEDVDDWSRDGDMVRTAADRLWRTIEAVSSMSGLGGLPVGLIGSSTGGAVALLVAIENPERISAVVTRGGRPDLLGARVAQVRCPVLMIVGAHDEVVLQLNRNAARLVPDCSLVQVAGATHLFDEPGTLKEAARLACGFFRLHLA